MPSKTHTALDALAQLVPGSAGGAAAAADGEPPSPWRAVLRSKGDLWLASCHDSVVRWTMAGVHFALEGTDEPWEGEGGAARRTDLVFIGLQLQEAEMRAELEACLLTDEEMAAYAATVARQRGGPGGSGGTVGATNPSLRFGLGAAVECNLGPDVGWTRGEVVAHDYREDAWDLARVVPYQVRLCPGNNHELDGMLIFAPMDEEIVIRAAGGASSAGTE